MMPEKNPESGVQTARQNSDEVFSMQIGIVNLSDTATLQIGLLNYKPDGFLPYFPIFNF